MPGRVWITVALALVAGLFTVFLCAKPGMTLPDDFTDSPVANVSSPTALAFTPDGRMLVTSRSGQLHVFDQNGNELSSPALNIDPRVCSNSERGLLGVAVDPDFATNHFIYLYYTFNKSDSCPEKMPELNTNPVNRVSRFVMEGNTVDEDSEEILLSNIPSPNGNHNGGDIHFGNDGNLYVSVGDGGCNFARPERCQYDNAAARYRHVLLGKVLRITRDGGIPQGNPFVGQDSARCYDPAEGGNKSGRTARGKTCQEIFALGFRNPFRFAVDPDTAVLRVNDVGGQHWEEIDDLDTVSDAGDHYGWNICEGRHRNPEHRTRVNCKASSRYTEPIHEYNHNTGCRTITGGAFVPNDGSWPNEDSYLFADFGCGKIFELTPDPGGGYSRTEFTDVPGPARPVAMAFGPYGTTQALYYTTLDFNGGPDQVRRITYTPPGP